MRAIIVTNGNAPLYLPEKFIKENDLIIAADGGLEIVELLGLDCAMAVGDFDSLTNLKLLDNVQFKRFDKDKDLSDTELAISYAKVKGCDEYVLVGGGEGRMDHLLGIWSVFKKYGPPSIWLTRKDALYLVNNKQTFKTSVGETVSIFNSVLGTKATVTCEKLKWPLVNYDITSDNISLSNVATNGTLQVDCLSGSVFVCFLRPREEL